MDCSGVIESPYSEFQQIIEQDISNYANSDSCEWYVFEVLFLFDVISI